MKPTLFYSTETKTAWNVFPSLIVSNRWIDWHVSYLHRGQIGFRTHFRIYIDRKPNNLLSRFCTVDCSMGEFFCYNSSSSSIRMTCGGAVTSRRCGSGLENAHLKRVHGHTAFEGPVQRKEKSDF